MAGAAVSAWSRLAWPGTGKVSLDPFLKIVWKALCLGKRQSSDAGWREWLFMN